MRWKLTPQRQLWRTCLHEAAHYAMSEWLGIASPVSASTWPKGDDSLGRYCDRAMNITWSNESVRLRIMVLVAGRAAERIIDGSKGWLDGTDFIRAYELRDKLPAEERHRAIHETTLEAEKAISTILWPQIVTIASFLFEHRELDGETLREIWWSILPDPQWRPPTPRALEEMQQLIAQQSAA